MKDNNFDFLRMISALTVLFSHSFILAYGGSYPNEPLYRLSHGQLDMGTIAVFVFFVISGYLITESWFRTPDYKRFFVARALRVFPGLAVCLIFTVFVVGLIATTFSMSDYFASPITWRYLANIGLFSLSYTLPGVFAENPAPMTVNGSIWTLPYEFFCYLGVMGFGILGWITPKLALALFLILIPFFENAYVGGPITFCGMFLAGIVLRLIRPIHSYAAAGIAIASLAITSQMGFMRETFALGGSYLVYFVATHPTVRLPKAARHGDFSYGIYVYGFPIQQLTVWWLGESEWWQVLIVATPTTIVLAVLSWHFVERHALALKRK